jgi:uncharacterized membrane protein
MNLGRLLTHTAMIYPEHTALIQGEQSWTWSAINARVDAMVAALRETSVLFAAILGAWLLKEPWTRLRLLGTGAIVCGVMSLRLG